MGLLNAGIHHLNKYVRVFVEFNHEFLTILHLFEGVFIDNVSVVEEKIVF